MKPVIDPSKNIILHVGMPKTGSTFLQRQFFPALGDVYDCYNESPTIVRELIRLAETPSLFFDAQRFRQAVGPLIAERPEANILVSHEELFGDFFRSYDNNESATRNLFQAFGPRKVILIIRRQDGMVESIYKQALQSYFYPSVKGFLNYRNGEFGESHYFTKDVNIDVHKFDLKVYVDNYVKTFGRENVLILPFELLRKDRDEYLKRLLEFTGLKMESELRKPVENKGYSLVSCYIALLLNRFVNTPRNRLGIIPDAPFNEYFLRKYHTSKFHRFMTGITRRISLRYFLQEVFDPLLYIKGDMIEQDLRDRILRLHAQSNQALDEAYDLGLKDYGYY